MFRSIIIMALFLSNSLMAQQSIPIDGYEPIGSKGARDVYQEELQRQLNHPVSPTIYTPERAKSCTTRYAFGQWITECN